MCKCMDACTLCLHVCVCVQGGNDSDLCRTFTITITTIYHRPHIGDKEMAWQSRLYSPVYPSVQRQVYPPVTSSNWQVAAFAH